MSTAEAASEYVRRMVAHETRGWGDQQNAVSRVERQSGIPFWTLNNLRTGRAKTVDAGVFSKIRSAYLAMCEAQITKLQHEIAIERAKGSADDALESIAAEAAALAEKIEARKG